MSSVTIVLFLRRLICSIRRGRRSRCPLDRLVPVDAIVLIAVGLRLCLENSAGVAKIWSVLLKPLMSLNTFSHRSRFLFVQLGSFAAVSSHSWVFKCTMSSKWHGDDPLA